MHTPCLGQIIYANTEVQTVQSVNKHSNGMTEVPADSNSEELSSYLDLGLMHERCD